VPAELRRALEVVGVDDEDPVRDDGRERVAAVAELDLV